MRAEGRSRASTGPGARIALPVSLLALALAVAVPIREARATRIPVAGECAVPFRGAGFLDRLEIAPGEAHLWIGRIPEGLALNTPEASCLSGDEKAEIRRIESPRKAGERIATRIALRRLLGAYLGIDPAEVAFVADAGGKPRLGWGADKRIRFNLAHSGGWFAVVVIPASLGDAGVDLETNEAGLAWDEVGTQALSIRELERLSALPSREAQAEFLRLWTLKEAIAKAEGSGGRVPWTQRDGRAVFGREDAHAWEGSPVGGVQAAVTTLGGPRPDQLIIRELVWP